MWWNVSDGETRYDDAVEADSLREALVEAADWLRDGDWSIATEAAEEQGKRSVDVEVSVWREDEDGHTVEEDSVWIEIPTPTAERDAEIAEGEILGQREGEWSTEQIIRMDDEYYYMHPNGGARGSHSRQGGDGVWRERPVEETREITRSEARCYLLDWGMNPTEVASKTRE